MKEKDEIDFDFICNSVLQLTEIHCYYVIHETHVIFNLYNYITDCELFDINYTWHDLQNVDETTIIKEIVEDIKFNS